MVDSIDFQCRPAVTAHSRRPTQHSYDQSIPIVHDSSSASKARQPSLALPPTPRKCVSVLVTAPTSHSIDVSQSNTAYQLVLVPSLPIRDDLGTNAKKQGVQSCRSRLSMTSN